MVDIVLLGPISNSHVNPAVTLGVLVRESGEERSAGKFVHNLLYAIRIILSQIGGAILGACIITLLRYTKEEETVGMARLCGAIGTGDCKNDGDVKRAETTRNGVGTLKTSSEVS